VILANMPRKLRHLLLGATAMLLAATLALGSLSPARGQSSAEITQAQEIIQSLLQPGLNAEQLITGMLAAGLSPEIITKVMLESPPVLGAAGSKPPTTNSLVQSLVQAFTKSGIEPAIIASALLQPGLAVQVPATLVAVTLVAAGVDPVTAAASVIAAAPETATTITADITKALKLNPEQLTQLDAAVLQAQQVIALAANESTSPPPALVVEIPPVNQNCVSPSAGCAS
jgi:hypothetical protein